MFVLGFLVSVVASLLDPLAWLGYLAAGIFIKQRLLSVVVGVCWRLLLHVVIIISVSKSLKSQLSFEIVLASLVSAALATLIVNMIAHRSKHLAL